MELEASASDALHLKAIVQWAALCLKAGLGLICTCRPTGSRDEVSHWALHKAKSNLGVNPNLCQPSVLAHSPNTERLR